MQVRRIDINKGDSDSPDYRSRIVGREFNKSKNEGLFAATPPLEALRVLLEDQGDWSTADGLKAGSSFLIALVSRSPCSTTVVKEAGALALQAAELLEVGGPNSRA